MKVFNSLKKVPVSFHRSFTARIKLERPRPWVLINAGIFMLSLYGSLTSFPTALGVISFVVLLISAAVGMFCFLKSL